MKKSLFLDHAKPKSFCVASQSSALQGRKALGKEQFAAQIDCLAKSLFLQARKALGKEQNRFAILKKSLLLRKKIHYILGLL
jgi:hypothetical protein